MQVQPTLLFIADIAGYTRFMKFHSASLVHAQDIVGQLLEAVIDAARPALRLAKIEGDAAFFFMPMPESGLDPEWLAERAATIYHAFHARIADLKTNTLCPCDGCQQAGQLRIKMVGHAGDVVTRKVGGSVELAGVDVILVHKLLKNDVPLPEYLLMTEPVYRMLDAADAARATTLPMELEDLGSTSTWYLELNAAGGAPAAVKLSAAKRVARQLRLMGRSLPYFVGRKQACSGFRNVDAAAKTGS